MAICLNFMDDPPHVLSVRCSVMYSIVPFSVNATWRLKGLELIFNFLLYV